MCHQKKPCKSFIVRVVVREQVSMALAGTLSLLLESRDGKKEFSNPPIYSKLFCWFILFYTHQIKPTFRSAHSNRSAFTIQ